MHILLLGGTGAMGISLTELLVEAGNTVEVTTRKVRSSKQENLRYIRGNTHDMPFLQELLSRHYDAIVDFMIYTTAEFAVRKDMLLAAADQYLFLSSSRVYADAAGLVTEESPRLLDVSRDEAYLKTDEYALRKARQEDLLRDGSQKNWTIIRPYITYNINRLQLGILEKETWLYRALHGRSIVFQREIAEHMTTLTYGYDVARMMVKLIGDPKALCTAVHLTAAQSIRWEDALQCYLDCIEEITGHRPPVYYLKDWHGLANVMGNQYQVQYDRLYDRMFDNTRAVQLCGEAANAVPPQEGLRKCMQAFLNRVQFGPIHWPVQGYMDRLANEKTSLSEIPSAAGKIKYCLGRYLPWLYTAFLNIKTNVRQTGK